MKRTLVTGVALLSFAAAAAPPPPEVFARVGDETISVQEFENAVAMAARRKFYHANVPPAQMAALQREVASELVDKILLAKEARKRGLRADGRRVEKTLAEYEQRYQASAQWQANRAALLPALRKHLEDEDLRNQLAQTVRAVTPPDARRVRQYYEQHPDKFTEPERSRVSLILLRVDPSSPREAWEKAARDGAALVKKLRAGADFAAAARTMSADASAANGGDMGYLHRGMLAEPAQLAVDKLKPGEISDPVTVLQGVAILRLDERQPARLNPFEKVEARARELLVREQSEAAWQALLARLRKATPVTLDEKRLLPRAAAGDGAR